MVMLDFREKERTRFPTTQKYEERENIVQRCVLTMNRAELIRQREVEVALGVNVLPGVDFE